MSVLLFLILGFVWLIVAFYLIGYIFVPVTTVLACLIVGGVRKRRLRALGLETQEAIVAFKSQLQSFNFSRVSLLCAALCLILGLVWLR